MFGKKSRKTLYEILGVGRDASLAEITSAHDRIRAEMRGPDVWIHPLVAAKVKVAFHTLRDPLKREAYDRSLAGPSPPPPDLPPVPPPPAPVQVPPAEFPSAELRSTHAAGSEDSPRQAIPPAMARPRQRRFWRSGWWGVGAGLGLVLVAAGSVGFVLLEEIDTRPAREYTGAEIAERISPHLGRVNGALVAGSRDLGLALATAGNEMVVPCREISAEMVLSVQVGTTSSRAELARANSELGLCVISVRAAAPEFELRAAMPARGELLYAIVREAAGAPLPLRVSAGRVLADPKGQAFEIEAQATLPNGTPVFDAQARLVGLVAAPHAHGDGVVAALGAARIAALRR
jgi:hypothetical protein